MVSRGGIVWFLIGLGFSPVLINIVRYWLFGSSESDLNLNSLLVKRQIDNPSPGAVTGGN